MGVKISELTQLSNPDNTDKLVILDTSASETKYALWGDLKISWKGAWSSETSYVQNHAVSHNGSSYICILESTNNEPPNATYWEQLTEGVDWTNLDAWDSGTTYKVNDLVTNDGSAYICILEHSNQEPPNATYWTIIVSKGDTGATGSTGPIGLIWEGAWSSETTYSPNDAVNHTDGNSYICILESTNNEPPNATYWNVLAQAGTGGATYEGDWDPGTTYYVDQMVAHNDMNYVCILESTNNEPPNATYWVQLGSSGATITADSFSEPITFLTTDLAAGKQFSVADFLSGGHLTKIRLRADKSAGQIVAGYMVVDDADGLAPADTSLAFNGQTGTWANGDYAMIVRTGEIIMINDADPATSPIDVTRGHMGTVAAYIDDDDEIIRLNNGFTLDIFYDSNRYPHQRIARIEGIMTSEGTTDAAIVSTNHYLELDGAMPNLSAGSRILIDDTVDEEAIVQVPPSDVATAAYDYIIYTEDALAAHDSGKNVFKVCEIDMAIPYEPAGTTLYGTLYWREANLGADIAVTLEVYGKGY